MIDIEGEKFEIIICIICFVFEKYRICDSLRSSVRIDMSANRIFLFVNNVKHDTNMR